MMMQFVKDEEVVLEIAGLGPNAVEGAAGDVHLRIAKNIVEVMHFFPATLELM